MALVNQGGKLLLKNGKLATGQECCCGEPCDPCSTYNSFPEIPFPASRMVGTWDLGGGPVAFDWLVPIGNQQYVNTSWENNSRPTAGMAVVAPNTRVNATLWRWDGTTETCNTYVDVDGIPEVAEGEVPALRTCGDAACAAWFYQDGVNAVMSVQEYRTLIDNPPPSDNQWYIFLWIEAVIGGPLAWHWAWIPACAIPCGDVVALTSGGMFPAALDIDTFTITCEAGAPCCTGNAEYPIYERPSLCGGHDSVDFWAQQSASDPPPCLGACCYNDGTDDVCGDMMTLAQCNALGGTWHSGQDCATDDPCNLFP
jgi:hypothetical protein